MARMIDQKISLPGTGSISLTTTKFQPNRNEVSGTIRKLALTLDQQKMEEANKKN